MIKYIEISNDDYYNLIDKSGYYVIKYPDGEMIYYKDKKWHREDGAAYINNGNKSYYLNYKWYGSQNDYTNESWTRFCKLRAFH